MAGRYASRSCLQFETSSRNHEKLNATRTEYESVRAIPTHFLVLEGHQDDGIEHIVLARQRFLVVEKEDTAAKEAKESDPRSDRSTKD